MAASSGAAWSRRPGRAGLAALGFHCCERDLEDELIRALGVRAGAGGGRGAGRPRLTSGCCSSSRRSASGAPRSSCTGSSARVGAQDPLRPAPGRGARRRRGAGAAGRGAGRRACVIVRSDPVRDPECCPDRLSRPRRDRARHPRRPGPRRCPRRPGRPGRRRQRLRRRRDQAEHRQRKTIDLKRFTVTRTERRGPAVVPDRPDHRDADLRPGGRGPAAEDRPGRVHPRRGRKPAAQDRHGLPGRDGLPGRVTTSRRTGTVRVDVPSGCLPEGAGVLRVTTYTQEKNGSGPGFSEDTHAGQGHRQPALTAWKRRRLPNAATPHRGCGVHGDGSRRRTEKTRCAVSLGPSPGPFPYRRWGTSCPWRRGLRTRRRRPLRPRIRPRGAPRPCRRAGSGRSPPARGRRGRSHGRAPAMTRRWTASPSGPPSSATRCSWSRASRGISAIASVGTYGALASHDVHPAAQRRGQTRRRGRPRRPGPAAGCAGRRRPPPGPRRRRRPRRRGPRASTAAAIAPTAAAEVDQHRRRAATSATTSSTSSAVRCRGTKTPGATASRSPQNSTQPTSCSSGSPASRRATQRPPARRPMLPPRRAARPPPRRRRTRPRAAAARGGRGRQPSRCTLRIITARECEHEPAHRAVHEDALARRRRRRGPPGRERRPLRGRCVTPSRTTAKLTATAPAYRRLSGADRLPVT